MPDLSREEGTWIIRELGERLQTISLRSPHDVYLYLDDARKLCNERLAALFRYKFVRSSERLPAKRWGWVPPTPPGPPEPARSAGPGRRR
jgi:hypothetical protein